jgi:cell division septum initiation protein DivIVA
MLDRGASVATWESDQTPLASPDRIRVPRFKTVRRGFDPGEVMEYLVWVSEHVETLESRVEQLQSESRKDAQGVGAHMADLMRTFDQVELLRREADRMVAEAKAEAERMRVDTQFETQAARADAQRTLRDAQWEADKILSELASRREAVLGDVRAIREDMLDAARGLEAAIEWGVDRRWSGDRGGGGAGRAPAPGWGVDRRRSRDRGGGGAGPVPAPGS